MCHIVQTNSKGVFTRAILEYNFAVFCGFKRLDIFGRKGGNFDSEIGRVNDPLITWSLFL